jgi:hypothetical protein
MTLDGLIDMILGEASEPLGVPGEYGVEVFYPSVNNHVYASNFADDESLEEEEFPAGTAAEYNVLTSGDQAAAYDGADEELEEEIGEPAKDDFARRLRERP